MAVSQLSIKYHSIHEALFLSSPEELATIDGVGNKSIRKILAFRELSHRVDSEKSSRIKSFHHPKDIYKNNFLHNPHAHIMITNRPVMKKGFYDKKNA